MDAPGWQVLFVLAVDTEPWAAPPADIETTIARGQRAAADLGWAVSVRLHGSAPGGEDVARIWPDGKVDLTSLGTRYA